MLYEKYLKQGTPMFVREANESIEVSKNEDLESFFKEAFEGFKNKNDLKISQKELKYLYLPFYLNDILKNIKSVQKTDKENKKLQKLKQKLNKTSKELHVKYEKMFTLIDELNLGLSIANTHEGNKKLTIIFENLMLLAKEYQNDIDNLKLLKEEKYQDYISQKLPDDYVDTEYIAKDDDEEDEYEETYNSYDDDSIWLGGAIAGVALLGAGALCYAFCGKSKDSLM